MYEHICYILCCLIKSLFGPSNASKMCVEQTNTKTPKNSLYFFIMHFLRLMPFRYMYAPRASQNFLATLLPLERYRKKQPNNVFQKQVHLILNTTC